MSEFTRRIEDVGILSALGALPTADNLAAHLDEIDRQRACPPNGESVIANMWTATRMALARYPKFSQLFEVSVNKESIKIDPWAPEGVPVSESVGKRRQGLQYVALRRGGRLPQTVRGWLRLIDNVERSQARLDELERVWTTGHVNTVIEERSGPIEVTRQVDDDQSGPGINWLDGGTSVQIGPNKTQLKDTYPYDVVTIVRPNGDILPSGKPEHVLDAGATIAYNRLLGAAAIGGEIITTDIEMPTDRRVARLALAASRPSEIADNQFRARHRRLSHARLPNVHFIQADLTSPEDMQRIRRYIDERGIELRFAHLGTVLNQIGQQYIAKVVDNVLSLLPEDGVLCILEFGQVDRRDERRFFLYPAWNSWTYGYFGIHKADPDRVINPWITFRDSRARVGRLEEGVAKLGGRELPFSEHVMQARAA